MSQKIFQALIKEIHEKMICQEYSCYVSFCSSVKLWVLGFKKRSSPTEYINKDKCLECEKDFNINFRDREKINIKEALILKLRGNGFGQKTVPIPFSHLTDYSRIACKACNGFTNIYEKY